MDFLVIIFELLRYGIEDTSHKDLNRYVRFYNLPPGPLPQNLFLHIQGQPGTREEEP